MRIQSREEEHATARIDSSRRRVVLGGLGMGLAWWIPLAGLFSTSCDDGRDTSRFMATPEEGLRAAQRIGAAFLAHFGDADSERDATALGAELRARLNRDSGLDWTASERLDEFLFEPEWSRRIVEAARNDFDQGRILKIERWWLSATEVHVCALVALA